jgi:ABC-type sugar transport system ATPase subunit
LLFVDRVIALRAGRIVGDTVAADTSYAQLLDLTVGAAGAAA